MINFQQEIINVSTKRVLTRSWHEGTESKNREHVKEFILENPKKFRFGYL